MKEGIKMYKVWNASDCKWIEVDDEWMEGVDTKDVEEFNYYSFSESLMVVYKDWRIIYYDLIPGLKSSWAVKFTCRI